MGRKLKILYTIPNFDTAGSGKALLNIAKRLNRSRFEPHICCMHDRGEFFEQVKTSGIPVLIADYTTSMSPRILGLFNSFKKSRIFSEYKFDVIHSFHYLDDYSEALIARLSGAKRWVFTKKSMAWNTNGWKVRSMLASGIVTLNLEMKEEFFPNKKRVQYIPRGVDTSFFSPAPRSKGLVCKFGVCEHDFNIVAVANLVSVKGIETLIAAFQNISKTQSVKLWIVGDDRSEYASQLKEDVNAKGLSENIIFTGKQRNVKLYYDLADLFVLPTLRSGRQEGCPVVLLEAMSSGVPVLVSELAFAKEALADHPECLFEPANVEDLTHKIECRLNKSRMRNAIGKTLRKKVVNNYSIDCEVERHEMFYESLFEPVYSAPRSD